MCTQVLLLLCFLVFFTSTRAITIAKCKLDDTNCIRLSAQAMLPVIAGGLPEFEMKSLDPLPMTRIDGSSPNLKLIASDVVVTGLKGCDVHRVSRDQAKINLSLLCSVNVKGDYDIKGKILFLPIDGKGNLIVSLTKVLISVQADLKDVEINGKKHWDITNWNFDFDVKEKANIELTNLFAGSEELSQAMKEMFGKAANEIVKEVGPPIVRAITGEVVDNINQFFHHVPVKELVIE